LGSVIGDILPFAVGMAVFPIPIIAAILLLFSPRARANGIAFASGWILGVAALTLGFALVAEGAGADSDRNTYAIVSWIKLLLGVGLLFLAHRQWLSRPAPGQDPVMPGWMTAIGGFTPVKALAPGLFMTMGNPKNIILAAGAGSTIGQAGLGLAEMAVVAALFTALASFTTASPVLYYLASGERAMAVLNELERWLVHNSATLMTLILLILGTMMIGNGMRGLSASG